MKRFDPSVFKHLALCLVVSGVAAAFFLLTPPIRSSSELLDLRDEPETSDPRPRVAVSADSSVPFAVSQDTTAAVDPPASDQRMEAYEGEQTELDEAKRLAAQSRPEEALRILQSILDKNPNSSQALYFMSRIYLDSDQVDLAYDTVLRAVERNPTQADVLLALVDIVERPISKHPQARKFAYDFLVELDTAQPSAAVSLALGRLEIQLGNLDQAVLRFRSSRQDERYMVASTINAASVLQRQGKYQDALQHYDAAVNKGKNLGDKLPADWQELRLNYALLLVERGQFEQAKQQLAALESEVTNPDTAWLYEAIAKKSGS